MQKEKKYRLIILKIIKYLILIFPRKLQFHTKKTINKKTNKKPTKAHSLEVRQTGI